MELAERYSMPLWRRVSWYDVIYAAVLVAGGLYAFNRFGSSIGPYEKMVLFGSVPVFAALGWFWRPIELLMAGLAVVSLGAIALYGGHIANADHVFLLKYFLSSQTSILWMCALFFMATVAYWVGLVARSSFGLSTGTVLTWAAVLLGFNGMLTRWYVSYLISPSVGHIPLSNLYDVFILFCLVTALLYLYYEQRYSSKQLGAFVLPIVAAAVGFLLWYTFDRDAYQIEPLVPALQSWWMKLHVPANFIGYGAFAVSAMTGVAYLAADSGKFTDRLPSKEVLDDLMYKTIALGFAFFTLATFLGAMWAAHAWGTYWQWDPKETWALIVWLNYAAWLHMRLMKGLRGRVLAWWALIGLVVTTFAFVGVDMFLGGLHSYGHLKT